MPKTTKELQDQFATPEEFIGRLGVWTVSIRGQDPVTFLVKIVDARKMWSRIDLQVESNTGDRFWVSNQTVKTLDPSATHG